MFSRILIKRLSIAVILASTILLLPLNATHKGHYDNHGNYIPGPKHQPAHNTHHKKHYTCEVSHKFRCRTRNTHVGSDCICTNHDGHQFRGHIIYH